MITPLHLFHRILRLHGWALQIDQFPEGPALVGPRGMILNRPRHPPGWLEWFPVGSTMPPADKPGREWEGRDLPSGGIALINCGLARTRHHGPLPHDARFTLPQLEPIPLDRDELRRRLPMTIAGMISSRRLPPEQAVQVLEQQLQTQWVARMYSRDELILQESGLSESAGLANREVRVNLRWHGKEAEREAG